MYFVGDFSDVVGILSLLFLLFLMFYGAYKFTAYTEDKKENEKKEREKDGIFYFEPTDAIGVRSGSGWIYYSRKTGEPLGAKGWYSLDDWSIRKDLIDASTDRLKDIQEEYTKKNTIDEYKIYSKNFCDVINALSADILYRDLDKSHWIISSLQRYVKDQRVYNRKRYKDFKKMNVLLDNIDKRLKEISESIRKHASRNQYGSHKKTTFYEFESYEHIPEKIREMKGFADKHQRICKIEELRGNLNKVE